MFSESVSAGIRRHFCAAELFSVYPSTFAPSCVLHFLTSSTMSFGFCMMNQYLSAYWRNDHCWALLPFTPNAITLYSPSLPSVELVTKSVSDVHALCMS